MALYLGTAGVGRITIVDHDVVDLTNLQRQIAHNLARVGQPKAVSAQRAVADINPEVLVVPIVQRADAQLLDEQVPDADVVIDCSDNFDTRHAINAACVRHGKPLVSGAAIRFDGQVSVYDTRDEASPCYACVFPPSDDFEETRCATMGVFAPLVGIVGAVRSGRGAQASQRRRPVARGPLADARRPRDGMARGARAAQSALPGVRGQIELAGLSPHRSNRVKPIRTGASARTPGGPAPRRR